MYDVKISDGVDVKEDVEALDFGNLVYNYAVVTFKDGHF